MEIRRAKKEDIDRILDLLSQVLEIHAKIRSDLFISGTTKYTYDELVNIINDDNTPVYVAFDKEVIGYAFCVIEDIDNNNMYKHKNLYIDDLCVDEAYRNQKIGKKLYDYVLKEASKMNCTTITLNVYSGNESALKFYESLGFKVRKMMMEKRVSHE